MAKSANKSTTKVTRIKATDSQPAKIPKETEAKSSAESKKVVTKKDKKPSAKHTDDTAKKKSKIKNPFAPVVRYVKGSWYELKQVRWPDRKNTWMMTGALLGFTLFFVVIILLLDAGFSKLFNIMLGK